MSTLPKVTISELLDAGVHFGHRSSKWNPKMAPYIYGIKDDIHVIDLRQTAVLMTVALGKIYEVVKNNGKVLFVSTKIQARDLVAEYAESCGQYYVNHRWLGGMLTNWATISKSIKKLDELEAKLANQDEIAGYTKKEILDITRKKDKLLKSLGGIRGLGKKPDLIVVIDLNKEHLAIDDALKLGIPILGIVDTNCDPDNIDYPVPGNDDAIRSIRLYCKLFAEAALAGMHDAMAASGVDIGSAANYESKSKSSVVKMKESNKVSHANLNDINSNEGAGDEFESGLENNLADKE